MQRLRRIQQADDGSIDVKSSPLTPPPNALKLLIRSKVTRAQPNALAKLQPLSQLQRSLGSRAAGGTQSLPNHQRRSRRVVGVWPGPNT